MNENGQRVNTVIPDEYSGLVEHIDRDDSEGEDCCTVWFTPEGAVKFGTEAVTIHFCESWYRWESDIDGQEMTSEHAPGSDDEGRVAVKWAKRHPISAAIDCIEVSRSIAAASAA